MIAPVAAELVCLLVFCAKASKELPSSAAAASFLGIFGRRRESAPNVLLRCGGDGGGGGLVDLGLGA